jgi:hypothetical protein
MKEKLCVNGSLRDEERMMKECEGREDKGRREKRLTSRVACSILFGIVIFIGD